MKIRVYLFLIVTFVLTNKQVVAYSKCSEPVYSVIERITDRNDLPVRLSLNPDGKTYFQYQTENGVLQIEGSSPVALCRGFYDFIKSNECGLYSWSGNNIRFPEQLGDLPPQTGRVSFSQPLLFQCVYVWIFHALLGLEALGKRDRLDGFAWNQYAVGIGRL